MPTLSKFLYNLLFILGNILFPVVTFSYAARVLGPEGIGKVQVVLSFAQYFVLVAALGIPVYGMREVAKVAGDTEKLSKLFSGMMLINLTATLILGAFYFILISVVGWFQPEIKLFYIGGAIILTGFLSVEWFYTGGEFFRQMSLRSVVVKSLSLAALFLFVRTAENLLIYLLINALAILTANLWNLMSLPVKIRLRLRDLDLRKHRSGLSILFAITLTISLYAVADTLVLRFLSDNEAVGYYTAAIRINKIMIPVIASLGVVLIPKITRSLASGDGSELKNLVEHSFAYICLLAVPLSAGLLIFAPEIMVVFSGSGFTDAIPAMQITSALALIIGFGHLFALQILIPGGHERKYLYATLCGVAISLIINLLLTPLFQEKGAAVAIIFAELAVTTLSFYYVKELHGLNFNWILVLKSMVSCLVFIPVAIGLRDLISESWIRLIIAVVASAGLYFLIQITIFREKQVREVASLLVNNWLR